MGHYWLGIMWLNIIGFSPWSSMCLFFLFVCLFLDELLWLMYSYTCILIRLTPSNRFMIFITISECGLYADISFFKSTLHFLFTLYQWGNLLLVTDYSFQTIYRMMNLQSFLHTRTKIIPALNIDKRDTVVIGNIPCWKPRTEERTIEKESECWDVCGHVECSWKVHSKTPFISHLLGTVTQRSHRVTAGSTVTTQLINCV